MYDIINRAQNLTLPVVTIDVTNVQRDPNRVFNKQDSFTHNTTESTTPRAITQYRTPVPVQISISLSILAGYQLDLEQIASNFMAYFNPYIILATKVPSDHGPDYDLEVRTKATWDGSLNISTPTQTTYADKFRRVGEANFILDAWIYPESADDIEPIYFIDANFYAVNDDLDTSSYYYLSGEAFTLSSYSAGTEHKETVSLSGTPTITNIFYAASGQNLAIESTFVIPDANERVILLYGHQFEFTDLVLLSATSDSLFSGLTSFTDTNYGTVSGYPLSSFEVLNNNMLQVTIPSTVGVAAEFDLVTYNQAGWSATYEVNQFHFEYE